jgi:U2 small nuclear ribonucleoprotein A'
MSAGVKLDYDVLSAAPTFLNAAKDRELNLRSLKLTLIENLILTKDQNEVIDLTDNEIRIFDNFPTLLRLRVSLLRLKTLLLSGNRIVRIDFSIAKYLPNLTNLILNNNHLSELGFYR